MSNKPFDPTNTIKDTSIPLPKPPGGDTHIHPYKDGHTITTRIPVPGVEGGWPIHDHFDKDGNAKK